MSQSSSETAASAVSLAPLKNHAVYSIVEKLTTYLGIGADSIALCELLSLVAGTMANPIHLDIASDEQSVDLIVADRVGAILDENVITIDSFSEFVSEEHDEFQDLSVLLMRRGKSRLFIEILECVARAPESAEFAPSVWRIVSDYERSTPSAAMLRLIARSNDRKLDAFAQAFSVAGGSENARLWLKEVLQTVCPKVAYRNQFQNAIGRAATRRDQMQLVVVERLLQVFVNLRRILSGYKDTGEVTLADFQAVRALLLNLPLVPNDRSTSAEAIRVGEQIFEAIRETGHQRSLPDRSEEGSGWFTRNEAARWTGLGYNTLKKHLHALEDDGIVISSHHSSGRIQGRQIYFRFDSHVKPPFLFANPFEFLPENPSVNA